MIFLGHQDLMTNELKHWKYLKVIDIMVIYLCPKTPADPILRTHNGAFGCACLHGIACHTTISIIWHTKKFNLVKWGVELKMNWLNWSIPISSGFQFQFNSNSKSFNSIPIQFILNWIELIINSNSIHELIWALRIAPLDKVSTPRMDLNGAVLSKRCRVAIQKEMRYTFKRVFHLVDLETVLNMLHKTSFRFKVYEGVRVGEIQAAMKGDLSE